MVALFAASIGTAIGGEQALLGTVEGYELEQQAARKALGLHPRYSTAYRM